MARERREQVSGAGVESLSAGTKVDVERADRTATEDEWRTQHGPEVVTVECLGPMFVGPVVRHLDSPLRQDRLGRDALAEPKLEAEHLRREVRDGDHLEHISLSVPQEHVAADRAEKRGRVEDDLRQDSVEVEGLGDASRGRQQEIELRGAILLVTDERDPYQIERSGFEAGVRS